MKINWTKGLTEKDKQDMEKIVSSSSIILNRLEQIVKEFDTEAEKTSLSATTLKDPNWAFAQAYIVGQRSAYKQILQLLDQGKQ